MQDSTVHHGHSNSKAKTSSRCASPSSEGLLGRCDDDDNSSGGWRLCSYFHCDVTTEGKLTSERSWWQMMRRLAFDTSQLLMTTRITMLGWSKCSAFLQAPWTSQEVASCLGGEGYVF